MVERAHEVNCGKDNKTTTRKMVHARTKLRRPSNTSTKLWLMLAQKQASTYRTFRVSQAHKGGRKLAATEAKIMQKFVLVRTRYTRTLTTKKCP